MIDWQLTATTVQCTRIEAEVTIFVYKDGSVNCTGFNRHHEDAGGTGGKAVCTELMCPRVTGYRDKLFSEEAARDA